MRKNANLLTLSFSLKNQYFSAGKAKIIAIVATSNIAEI